MEDCREIFVFETLKPSEERFWPEYQPDRHRLFYGARQFYDFLRNLHCIYERLKAACENVQTAFDQEMERRPEIYSRHESTLKAHTELLRAERYQIFYRAITSFVLGELDAKSFESLCELAVGSRAYLLFTIGNLMHSVTRIFQQQVLGVACAEKTLKLFHVHCNRRFAELVYWTHYNRVLSIFSDAGEAEVFRILYDTEKRIMTVHYFEIEGKEMSSEQFVKAKDYVVKRLVGSEKAKLSGKVFLSRNTRFEKKSCKKVLYNTTYKIVLCLKK